jgi:signal transduction histidine kinase
VDLNLLAEQVVTAHLPLAEANGLKLLFEPDRRAVLVQGEQNQIARMITNLVSNAIRYTRNGHVGVRLQRSNGYACLLVEDSGIGIEPQDLPHLFERFYRGKNVRQTETHGTGLGLAIVKEIVDLHEGRIEVESVPGSGAKFRVWLPALTVDLQPVLPAVIPPANPA